MTHRTVTASGLPAPVGPYSPGMQFERLIFVSGRGATDPATGKLVGPGPVEIAAANRHARERDAANRQRSSEPRMSRRNHRSLSS